MKEHHDFFGGIASKSSGSFASFFAIDIPMYDTTSAVIIIPPSRMVLEVESGNAMASIRNRGIRPIAIIFIWIS